MLRTHSEGRKTKKAQASASCAGTAGICNARGTETRQTFLACFKANRLRERDDGYRVGHDSEDGELNERGESELHPGRGLSRSQLSERLCRRMKEVRGDEVCKLW